MDIRFAAFGAILFHSISGFSGQNTTHCPPIEQVTSHGSWSLSAPGWKVMNMRGKPGTCPVFNFVEWDADADEVYGDYPVKCWYTAWDGNEGMLQIYLSALVEGFSRRYIQIHDTVSCDLSFAPYWREFVSPGQSATPIYRCTASFKAAQPCPIPTGNCSWSPLKVPTSNPFPKCQYVD